MTPDEAARIDVAKVGRKAEAGVRWNLASAVVTNLARIASLTVLARLLSPDEFGVVASATLVISLLAGLRDLGLGPALVQKNAIEPRHEDVLFAASIYLGALVSVSVALAAPWLSRHYFNEPNVAPILQVLALLYFVRGTSMLSMSVAKRRLAFVALTSIETLAYIVGVGISIATAWLGWGAWALVAGYAVESLLAAGALLWRFPPRWTLRWSWATWRELSAFGGAQTLAHGASLVAIWGDNAVIAGAMPKAQLAAYGRAYDLIRFPANVFSSVVGAVLFPAMSRLQHERALLATGFVRAIGVSALVLIPVSAVAWVCAPDIIAVLLGPQWHDAVGPFRILLVSMHFRTAYKTCDLVLRATGVVWPNAWILCGYAVAVVVGAVVTVQYGLAAVAASTSGAVAVTYFALGWLAVRHLPALSIADFLRAHVTGVLLAGVIGGIAWIFAQNVAQVGSLVRLIVVGGAATLMWFAAVVGLVRYGNADAGWLRDRVRRQAARDAGGR